MLLFFSGISVANAQDEYVPPVQNRLSLNEKSYSINQSLEHSRRSNDFAIGFNLAYNPYKLGAGVSFSYNFTDMLRFSLGGDYYFHTSSEREFKTITSSGIKDVKYWGRVFDINPNLNIVFGDGDFHFYLIGGLYLCSGYHETANVLSDSFDLNYTTDAYGNEWHDTYVIMDGEIYYFEEELIYAIGLGINAGCGIEYQLSDQLRLGVEQQLSLGLMTSWMAKLGIAYCF